MSGERRCFSCGYDLSGIGSAHQCPECGRPALDERDVLDHSAIKDRRRTWMAVAALVALFVVFVLICSHGLGLM